MICLLNNKSQNNCYMFTRMTFKMKPKSILTFIVVAALSTISLCVMAKSPSYEIEVSHNDELFIINGEKFEAQTYCFNMEEGDRVIFIEGSALGACASATLVNLRTKEKCEVWCE